MTEVKVPFDFGRRKPGTEASQPPKRYPARIARQLALAHALQKRVDTGEFVDYADMARALGFSRARISQLMDLLLLPPDVQEEVLALEDRAGSAPITERDLRAITPAICWSKQRHRWREVRGRTTPGRVTAADRRGTE